MSLPYHILDVFTTTPFLGNPLAIVLIPPNITLNGTQKQRIAREFNLSETVFVHPEQAESTSRNFDIYTPQAELPFAGHPTIGTAVHLLSQNVKTLVAKAGRISIEILPTGGGVRCSIPHNVHLHSKRLGLPTLNAPPSPILLEIAQAEVNAPLFSLVPGMTFALIELPSLKHLAAVRVGIAPDLPVELLDEEWRQGWVTRRYYYVRIDDKGTGRQRIRTRNIKTVPAMEDPATGSAACALASYLSLYGSGDNAEEVGIEVTQGVEMGRESRILLDVRTGLDGDGCRRIASVHLGGTAVDVASGRIAVPP